MDAERVKHLLDGVRAGRVSVEDALRELRDLPFRSLGFANADTHRQLRTGFAEVILGAGKSAQQIATLLDEIGRGASPVLATRVPPDVARDVIGRVPGASYLEIARMVVAGARPAPRGRGAVAVVSAGTADIPVAEEAAVTAEMDGNEVRRVFDVGVAGLHRLLAHRAPVESAEVVVVVAGMDGALPSVLGGLFARPIIAVPTSVGYGASFGGISALLAMLNSCAAGVTVVNIDNGFGAGRAASMFNRVRAA